MAYWLLKSEPSVYPYSRLVEDGKTIWDGVANNLALIHLRKMKKGDDAIFYHTDDERACVGLAKVVSASYADPKEDDPKLVVVDVKPVRALKRAVTLAEIKGDSRFVGFDLIRNSRLSVVPVNDAQWAAILDLESRAAR